MRCEIQTPLHLQEARKAKREFVARGISLELSARYAGGETGASPRAGQGDEMRASDPRATAHTRAQGELDVTHVSSPNRGALPSAEQGATWLRRAEVTERAARRQRAAEPGRRG